ncbi:S-adenosylmethionine mitochondrial carrier protein [Penicillium rolfsii]|nr:S-adenosylmethionine mitochondrial carrier protein [Penicillium rolfsii]
MLHSDIWVAGAFAALVVDFIVYPVDTLKTRIQSPNYEKIFKDARTGAVRQDVLFRGLYQGVWSVVFSTIPSSGAFFTTYEAIKCALHDSSTRAKLNSGRSEYFTQSSRTGFHLPFTHSLPSPIINGIASSTAEAVSCFMLTPAEVLKQNAQMVSTSQSDLKAKAPGNSVSAMRQVLSRFKGHPWRLWNGYFALLGRNLPFTGIQFPLFEYIRSHVIDRYRRRKAVKSGGDKDASSQRDKLIERAGLTGLSASVSGSIASVITTPIDVIKTRVMLSASDDPGAKKEIRGQRGPGKGSRTGTWAVGKQILRDDGVRGLFKGGLIRSVWTAVSLSLYLGLYEGGRFYLENRRRRLEEDSQRL